MMNYIDKILNRDKGIVETEALNIVNSMGKANPLYKRLIKYAHPDKLPNNPDLALSLTKMLNENRYNYNELLKIEKLINESI